MFTEIIKFDDVVLWVSAMNIDTSNDHLNTNYMMHQNALMGLSVN